MAFVQVERHGKIAKYKKTLAMDEFFEKLLRKNYISLEDNL